MAIVVDTDVVSYLFKGDTRAALYQTHLDGQMPIISLALVQTLSIEHQEPKRSFTLHAASTASQTCGTSAATLLMFDVSNCPFLIFCTNSIPLKVTAALLKLLNPSIG